jgi:putative transport protein
MLQLLIDNPLLLLLTVAAIGYPLGRLKVGGISLGVAAVLFVGLAIGSLHPDLKLPELVYQAGLVVFVYTLGLSSGQAFFVSLGRKGLRDNIFALSMLVAAALLTSLTYWLLNLTPALMAGVFAGSLTNTPALAGGLEYIKAYAVSTGLAQPVLDQMLAEPVVAYSITYPMGVIGSLLSIALVQRLWKINYAAESQRQQTPYKTNHTIDNRTILITRPQAALATVRDLVKQHKWDVVFGRIQHNEHLAIIGGSDHLAVGDLITVVGAPEELDRVIDYLGEPSKENLEFNRRDFDYRRVFISNPVIAGHTLNELQLPQQFDAVLTRLRRGDVEFVPHGDTVLELGDRVRVLTSRQNLHAVSALLGDSYRGVSEIDILSFSLGLALGLLLGLLPFPLPGGITLRLGLAGGPLMVALILGAVQRTGPIVWVLPYSANLTLRQVGIILFLAGVGTRAGYIFVMTLTQGSGLAIFAAGALLTFMVALVFLWVGYKLLKIPMGILVGMLAALQTQPAVLGFALEQTKDDQPNIGYAAIYPLATVGKIVLAQLLLAFFLTPK